MTSSANPRNASPGRKRKALEHACCKVLDGTLDLSYKGSRQT